MSGDGTLPGRPNSIRLIVTPSRAAIDLGQCSRLPWVDRVTTSPKTYGSHALTPMYREPLAVPSCSKQKDRFILSAKRSRVLSRSSCRYFFLCASSYFLSLASLFFEKQFLEHPAPQSVVISSNAR